MWDSAAQQRAARSRGPRRRTERWREAGTAEPATGFPVPPLDLPHYHGVRGLRRQTKPPSKAAVDEGGHRCLISSTRSRGSASPSRRCSGRSTPSSTRRSRGRPRRGSTAATSSTGGRTGWRSASAASCARGPARRTPSTSRAGTTRRTSGTRPASGTGRVYQINYLRCILCGLCIEACPTRALTMTNEYEIADDNRENLIWTKEQLLVPLQPDMEAPPHPMRLGDGREGLLPARRGGADRRSPRARHVRSWRPVRPAGARPVRRTPRWPGRRRKCAKRAGARSDEPHPRGRTVRHQHRLDRGRDHLLDPRHHLGRRRARP